MPKEIINCYRDKMTVQVELGWGRDHGEVQIATTNFGLGDEVGPGDPARGWFVTLDRNGINRLIRSLRKARDQAFGADA